MKRRFALVMMIFLLLGAPSVYAQSQQPNIVGQYAVSMDAKTGDILYDKDAHHRAYPASITKILTAIILLEHTKPEDRITFSQKALEQEKSNYQVDFHVGDSVDRDTALTIMMVLSANDMAYAIAESVSGSAEEFSTLMNEEAAKLGAKDSHFVTPNGLQNPDHYTTPYDMALIAREASKHPEIMKAMMTKRTTVTTSRQTLSILNKARYFEHPYAIAGKTGFTNEAHNTLVEMDEKDGNRIINVVMDSHNPAVYDDMNNISNYAFTEFKNQTVLDKNDWNQSALFLDKSVPLELERSSELEMKKGEGKNVKTVFHQQQINDQTLYDHGITKGQVIGKVDIEKNGFVIDSIPAVAKENATFPKPPLAMMGNSSIVPVGLGILTLIFLRSVKVMKRKRRRKRKRSISA